MSDIQAVKAELDAFLGRPEIKESMVRDLARIVAIPSVKGEPGEGHPFGDECARALDEALEMGREYGFETENHDYYCGSIIYGDSEQEMGIVVHLDVVPAGDGWDADPFMLRRDGDMLIGRGTDDDKGPFITALYTLRFLRETGKKLPFSVRIILGCDEESGCSDLEHFASVRKIPFFSFTPDSEYPVGIGEKGMYGFDVVLDCGGIELSGGSAPNAVAASASAKLRFPVDASTLPYDDRITVETDSTSAVITAEGISAHAAMPENGANAIGILCSYLISAGLSDSPSVKFLAESCTDYLGKAFGIDCADDKFGPLTCIGSMVGTKDGKTVQNYNVRYPISADINAMRAVIAEKAAALGGSVENESISEGYYKDPDSDEIKALTEACEAVLDIPCVPYTMGGGSYARHMRDTVVFGAGIPSMRGLRGEGKGGPHENEEYFTVTELESGVRIFALSVLNIARKRG